METLAMVKICVGKLYERCWVDGSALTGPYVEPLHHEATKIRLKCS